MSANSKIEWTDATWNPTRGCSKISPGCLHCYAETWAERFRGVKDHPYEFGFDLRLAPHLLVEPLRWASGKRVFVNSMSDLFHEKIPDDYIVAVASVMQVANWHTFQVLTKRPERMAALLNTKLKFVSGFRHIWWGVSVEDRKHGLPRLRALKKATAAVKFLSCEPLLEDLGAIDLAGVHWVIVGGESGPGARKMEESWAINIRNRCTEQKIAFFFKQWGGVRKHLTGRELEGQNWDESPKPSCLVAASLQIRRQMIANFQDTIRAFTADTKS